MTKRLTGIYGITECQRNDCNQPVNENAAGERWCGAGHKQQGHKQQR